MKEVRKLSEIPAVLTDHINKLRNLADEVSQLESKLQAVIGHLGRIDRELDLMDTAPPVQTVQKPDQGDERPVIIEFNSRKTIGDTGVIIPKNRGRDVSLPARHKFTAVTCKSEGSRQRMKPSFPSETKLTTGHSANIIFFPGHNTHANFSANREAGHSGGKHMIYKAPILAAMGMPVPPELHDFRPVLQRDGLILLAWDKRISEIGERYTAYWVTSTGIPRFYASRRLPLSEFPSAQPDHKSYAAEDGIEFYGQETPLYLVHVAPELMMSNPQHGELRSPHIDTLKHHGNKTDFDYKYLLTKDKRRDLPIRRPKNDGSNQAGA